MRLRKVMLKGVIAGGIGVFVVGMSVVALHKGTTVVVKPANKGLPVIRYTPWVGEVLRVSKGAWNKKITKYVYAWWRCSSTGKSCVLTRGTQSNYHVVDADIGHELEAEVTVYSGNSKGAFKYAPLTLVVLAVQPERSG